MDELLVPIIVVIISMVANIFNAAKKQKQRQASTPQMRGSTLRRDTFQPPMPKAPAAPSRPASPARPTPAAPVVAPTVHAHLEPDCAVHDAVGSMDYVSTEGKDPCHEDQLNIDRTESVNAQNAPALTLEWSGEAMVKAFVMQEILTRPGQRHAR